MIKRRIFSSTKGISILEMVVYVSILGMIAVMMANFLISITRTYQQTRAEREILSNARLLLEAVTKAVSQATEIYAPTSMFNNDGGQLSLVTVVGAQPEHTVAYADLWVDSGVLYIKSEGQPTQRLSSASIRINKFRIERIVQALATEAVRITLEAGYFSPGLATPVTLNSTIALRGSY